MSITLYHSFDDLPPAEVAFFEQHAASFDQTLPWMKTLSAHVLSEDEHPILACLRDGERVRAILPLIAQTAGGSAGKIRELRALSNYYTALYAPLIAPDEPTNVVCQALADGLREQLKWPSLDLNPLAQDAATFEALAEAFSNNNCVLQRYMRFGNWYLEIDGRDFEQYEQSLASKVRNTINRKERKLRREHPEVELQIVTEAQHIDPVMDEYEHIYTMSWKQDEPYKDCIREIVREFANRGWLRLGVCRVDGKAAAAQLWFTYRGTANIFKLAYNPEYQRYSVGSILTRHLMREAIDTDGVQVIDYLCGDDNYKKDWMSHRRERWGLRIYRPTTLVGLAGSAKTLASRWLRSGT